MDVRSSYTRLLVRDFKACLLFYRDVLEFDVTVNDEENGYAEFKAGDMRLSIFRRQEMAHMIGNIAKPSYAECQDNFAVIFTVPNLEEVYHQLTHKGVKFTAIPTSNPDYKIKTAYLRDPDENLLGLYQFID